MARYTKKRRSEASLTKNCLVCGSSYIATGRNRIRQKYCSSKCKEKSHHTKPRNIYKDEEDHKGRKRPKCESGCGKNVKAQWNHGKKYWTRYCPGCTNKIYDMDSKSKRQRYKEGKTKCEHCGFVAIHPCQLDVDHILATVKGGIDEPENWQLLCANCHRLKTQVCEDWANG